MMFTYFHLEIYKNFEDVLKRISNARIRAYHQVNSILIELLKVFQ